MTDRNELQTLRTIAKRRARATRTPLHNSLDEVAAWCGHAHWNALTKAWDNGWRPSTEELEVLQVRRDPDDPLAGLGDADQGTITIAGVPCEIEISWFHALIAVTHQWCIYVDHAPSEPPKIEKYRSPNPLDDPAFLQEVLKVANAAGDRMREYVSSDWPRRSTKPDKDGRAEHPLFHDLSADWYCLHCDTRSTGAQMAENMWHCPHCNATPVDMHSEPWWDEPPQS